LWRLRFARVLVMWGDGKRMSDNRTRKLAQQDKTFFMRLYHRRKSDEEATQDIIAEWGGKSSRKKKLRKSNWEEDSQVSRLPCM